MNKTLKIKRSHKSFKTISQNAILWSLKIDKTDSLSKKD